MIGWEPRYGDGPWHLTGHVDEDGSEPKVAFCGVRVAGVGRYVQRDPHKIDHYGGRPCPECWHEWQMQTAASYAEQDQYEAGASTDA